MKLNKKQLPFYAAAVQTIQYSFAGWLYFSWIGLPVVGSMGALISFSVAYAASQISDIGKSRKFVSWLAMIALMVLSPVIIGTSLFYSLTMITNPVWRGVVSAVWGLLPDGATALAGFIAGKGLVDNSDGKKPAARGAATRSGRSAKGKRGSKSLSELQVTVACRYNPQCDRTFTKETLLAANNAANAHAAKCKYRPIDTALPVQQQKIEKQQP